MRKHSKIQAASGPPFYLWSSQLIPKILFTSSHFWGYMRWPQCQYLPCTGPWASGKQSHVEELYSSFLCFIMLTHLHGKSTPQCQRLHRHRKSLSGLTDHMVDLESTRISTCDQVIMWLRLYIAWRASILLLSPAALKSYTWRENAAVLQVLSEALLRLELGN